MATKHENGSKGWEIDLSAWQKARDYNDWNKIASSGDMEKISGTLATLVKAWPFEGDPGDPEAILDLDMDNWIEALAQVGEAVTAKFQNVANRRK